MIIGRFQSLDVIQPVSVAEISDILARNHQQLPHCSNKKLDIINRVIECSVPLQWRSQYAQLLQDFHDVISEDNDDLGHTDVLSHDIQLRDKEPVYTKQFPIPEAQYLFIKSQIAKWLTLGLIQPSRSKYNAPIFCVKKKDSGQLRVVLDYRRLNEKTLPDKYSMRTVEECIATVGNDRSKIFSTLDLTSGFWQMQLKPDCREYTAFTLPGVGQYEWKMSPMGLTGCPASFARLMDVVMRNVPNVITYIDDVLIHTRDHNLHLSALRRACDRLRYYHLKLNLDKCQIGSNSVPYLGHTLTSEGVKPGKDKILALASTNFPHTLRQMRSFLGLANYFRTYVPNYSRLAAPLYKTTRSDFHWKTDHPGESAQLAFKKIKEALTARPLMAFPNRDGRFHLYVDASLGDEEQEGGLGAALFQSQPDGTQRPIAYASRQLQAHERNYSAFLLELRAVVYGLETFHHHVFGRQFTVYTDHKPLSNLSRVHTKTLNRLHEEMLKYNFDVKHIPGPDNAVADYLSRSAETRTTTEAVELDQVANAQSQDHDIQHVIREIEAGRKPPDGWNKFPGELIVFNGLLHFQPTCTSSVIQTNPIKLVVPPALTLTIAKEMHSSPYAGHMGFFKTRTRVRELYWWPGMDQDIEDVCLKCITCNRTSNKYTL